MASSLHGPHRVRFFNSNPRHELLAGHTRYVETAPSAHLAVHPLVDIAAAHRALEAGGVHSMHVIQIE